MILIRISKRLLWYVVLALGLTASVLPCCIILLSARIADFNKMLETKYNDRKKGL